LVTREGLAALVAELHRHERGARVGVGVGLGVADVLAGQLRVVLQHREALDLRRLVRLPLLLHDHDPLGDLDHARAVRRPAGAEGLELRAALGALRVLVRVAGLLVVLGEQLLAVGRRLVRLGADRLLVRPDRRLVGAEQVVAVLLGVVLAVRLLGRVAGVRHHVRLLRLALLLRGRQRGVVQTVAA
jgi:hypothetical protein